MKIKKNEEKEEEEFIAFRRVNSGWICERARARMFNLQGQFQMERDISFYVYTARRTDVKIEIFN